MGFTSADLPLLRAPFFFHTVANRLPRWLEVVFTAWPAGWNWRSRECGAYTFLCQPGWGVPRNLNWGTGPGMSMDQPSRAMTPKWATSMEGDDVVNLLVFLSTPRRHMSTAVADIVGSSGTD
jgi:hypothetical protein